MAHKDYSQQGIGANFEVGKNGVRVKHNSGAAEIRNNADADFAVLRAATPVGDDDVVTKGYLERRYNLAVTGQINGGAPPAAGTPGRVYICTTAGGTYTINYLYRDDGSTWEEIVPYEGMIIGITDALTGGTVEFLADHVYIWDLDAAEWDDVGPSASSTSKLIEQRTVTLAYTDAGGNNIGAAVPANAKVLEARVNVTQAFDGTTPTITIGDGSDPDRLMTIDENDLTETGLFDAPVQYIYGISTQLTATLSVTGATQGQCNVTVVFANA